jgi:hypothetical protein
LQNTDRFMPDRYSAANGTLLALQFVRCLGAELGGEDFPDPYGAQTADRSSMDAALAVVRMFLDVPNTKQHRHAVGCFLAALGDVIERQGGDLQMMMRRIRNPGTIAAGTVAAELTAGGNLEITAHVELPDFAGLEPRRAAEHAADVSRTVLHELVPHITDAVFTAAGLEMEEPAQ